MGLDRRKKVTYGVVLALSVSGLIADRVMRDGPQAADARTPEGASADAAASADAPQASDRQPDEALSPFPENLPAVDWDQLPHDPFALPASLAARRRERLGGNAPPQKRQVSDGVPSVTEFSERYRLNGVFLGETAMAIVNGRIIQAGQDVDGAKLLRVEGNHAYFQCRDGVAELVIHIAP